MPPRARRFLAKRRVGFTSTVHKDGDTGILRGNISLSKICTLTLCKPYMPRFNSERSLECSNAAYFAAGYLEYCLYEEGMSSAYCE
jgi:hypothetical protein